MGSLEITSSQARKKFYQIIKRVGEGGDNYTVKVYQDAKVRFIREEFAKILEEIIGAHTWEEIHRLMSHEPKLDQSTKETIKKIIKPKTG